MVDEVNVVEAGLETESSLDVDQVVAHLVLRTELQHVLANDLVEVRSVS
jgi:hypothetical protein